MSEGMNEHLANIYGTGGMEKRASAESGLAENLSDLALLMVTDHAQEGSDLTKVAAAHGEKLGFLVEFDQAGRAMAHNEFGQMEKQAAEGDPSALAAFFGEPVDERAALKQALVEEIQRRSR